MAKPFSFNPREIPNGSVSFEIDSTEITQSIEALHNVLPSVFDRIGKRTEVISRQLIGGAFVDAFSRLSYDQFAPEFRDAMLTNLQKLPITTIVSPSHGEVSIDIGALGTIEDLEKAFHRHAVLEGGHKLTEPYAGQALAITDANVRHEFFEAMLHGEPFQTRDGHILETAGLWDATKKEYLEIWGDKSPQWLYLEYGQSRFEPKIPAFGLLEQIQEDLDAVVDFVFQEEIDAAMKIVNPEQFGITRTANRGLLQSPAGGITIRGHNYAGGQFTPRSL